MVEYKIKNTVSSDLSSAMAAYSVDTQATDGPTDQKETSWITSTWNQNLGYYKTLPELRAVIDVRATWAVGKGYFAEPETAIILDGVKGWGKDSFNSIIENLLRTADIDGNAYAEIIRDKEKNPINLKPIDPEVMRHIVNGKGILIRFEQTSKINKAVKKFDPEEIFYISRNRTADEIHGIPLPNALVWSILAKNEAMIDMRTGMHRNIVPRWKFKLKTDEPSEIAAYKTKMDKATGESENIYEPFDTSESELIAVAPNATLNPLPWIQYLEDHFYLTSGVPKIILGGTGGFTEAAVKIAYLAFQQTIEEIQLMIEEQIGLQLGMEVKFEFPASLENELLSDNKKDGPENIDPSETTAEVIQ